MSCKIHSPLGKQLVYVYVATFKIQMEFKIIYKVELKVYGIVYLMTN